MSAICATQCWGLASVCPRDVRKKGSGLTRVSKVKGHADDDMVRSSQVRELGREGNDKVDDAAD